MSRRKPSCPQYTYSEKKRVLEAFLLKEEFSNMPAKEFCKICGVSYPSFLRWGRRIEWDASRIEELRRSRKKKEATSTSTKLEEAVERKILAIKTAHKNWGPLKIKQYLWRHEQRLIPQTSIYKFLKLQGLVKERQPSEENRHDRKFEYDYPMAAVQMDLMHLTLTDGETIYLVTLLDDYSRYVLQSRFIAVKTMDEVTDVFKETVRRYGVMDVLLTDHGSEFVSWQKLTRFEQLLVDLDVNYIASGPDKKENQGKVERWHQTVREELRMRGPVDQSSEAQLWIRELVDMYNYERPHQGIGGLLPADRFFGMREELEAELERYKANTGKRLSQQIYFVCRVGEKKLVVSGERPERVTLRLDGKQLSKGKLKTEEEFQLEKTDWMEKVVKDDD